MRSKQFQSCSFATTAGWRWGTECECDHSTGKLSTSTRQEQICVSQNEKGAICGERSCYREGREAAERRKAQVYVQLEGSREQGGCSPLWESSSEHCAKSRLERGWKGCAQRKEAAARRGTARCQHRKWRVGAVCKGKSLRSMASAQPHSAGQEAVLRDYNTKKYWQTPKQTWKLPGRNKA